MQMNEMIFIEPAHIRLLQKSILLYTPLKTKPQTRACTQAIYLGNIISGSKSVRPDALKRKGGNADAKASSRQIVLWMTYPQPDQDLLKSESGSLSVVSDSLGPHGLGTSRFLCPWYSLSKNTSVGCHFSFKGSFFLSLSLSLFISFFFYDITEWKKKSQRKILFQ